MQTKEVDLWMTLKQNEKWASQESHGAMSVSYWASYKGWTLKTFSHKQNRKSLNLHDK